MIKDKCDSDANNNICSTASIIGAHSGVSARMWNKCSAVVQNCCTCCGSWLPAKEAFRDKKYLERVSVNTQACFRCKKEIHKKKDISSVLKTPYYVLIYE